MTIRSFYENVYVAKANNFNTALTGATMPASGSYYDTSDYEHFAFLIELGTLDSSLTFTVAQATGASATTKAVTGASVAVVGTDDNKWALIDVETRKLDIANGYRYVTLNETGSAGGNDYACVTFFGYNTRHAPVTQSANLTEHAVVSG